MFGEFFTDLKKILLALARLPKQIWVLCGELENLILHEFRNWKRRNNGIPPLTPEKIYFLFLIFLLLLLILFFMFLPHDNFLVTGW